jgi:hypothetical protein
VLAAVAKRGFLTLLDQGLSSLSNVGVFLVASRVLDPVELGQFSVVYIIFVLTLTAARGLISEPLLMILRGKKQSTELRGASGASISLGLVVSVVLVIVGLSMRSPMGGALLALALPLPLLLLQDVLRFASLATRVPIQAVISDATWLILAAGFLALIWLGPVDATAASCMLAWGIAGGIAAITTSLAFRCLPAVGAALGWIKRHRELSLPYVAEYSLGAAATQGALLSIALFVGLAALGETRAVLAAMGPAYVAYQGINSFAIAEIASGAVRVSHRTLAMLQTALGSIGLLLGLVLLVLPGTGRLLLGDIWGDVSDLVPALTLFVAGEGAIAGARASLRSRRYARDCLRARLLTAPVVLLVTGVCAAAGGQLAAVWGLAIATTTSGVVWTLVAHRRADGLLAPGPFAPQDVTTGVSA